MRIYSLRYTTLRKLKLFIKLYNRLLVLVNIDKSNLIKEILLKWTRPLQYIVQL